MGRATVNGELAAEATMQCANWSTWSKDVPPPGAVTVPAEKAKDKVISNVMTTEIDPQRR